MIPDITAVWKLMKNRYYLSMLSLFPIIILFDSIYFIYHRSLNIFLGLGFVHFLLFVVLNLIGAYYIFKPVDRLLLGIENSEKVKHRIERMTWISTGWILLIGSMYVAIAVIPLYFFPDIFKSPEDFTIDKIPERFFFYSILPSIFFVYAVFPSFLAYFIINDFTLNLKDKVASEFNIRYSAGKKRIGLTLFTVFLFLVILPSLLVILELKMAFELEDKYSQFTKLSPLETLLIDRFVVFIGTVIAVILITRSFTKPIDILLKTISKVSEGDYSAKAAVITDDEIGILTKEFNGMVSGLKERELIRDTFGKYVTKDVASHILGKEIHLEGEVRHCTILVTDIAGYTAISEELTPKEIVQMLNEYFSVLVGVIQKHKGVVNKFIGDSIFAMFNVPLDDEHHASNAVRAALEIEQITKSSVFGKDHHLNTRIGVNTGVVVAGNIGSSDRMEYTVIGDDVNIAARLEQLNKEHGTNILIGENTYNLTSNDFHFTQLGDFQLKGKEKRIKVFKVTDLPAANITSE